MIKHHVTSKEHGAYEKTVIYNRRMTKGFPQRYTYSTTDEKKVGEQPSSAWAWVMITFYNGDVIYIAVVVCSMIKILTLYVLKSVILMCYCTKEQHNDAHYHHKYIYGTRAHFTQCNFNK
jgi:hypothetical protein